MKLNHNCVRDVLLFLEAEPYVITNSDGDVEFVGVWFHSICDKLPHYPQEVIYYTLSKLAEGGYLDMSTQWASGSLNACCVNYITYSGHEFLEKIKPDTVWERTTKIAGVIGNFGLQMLSTIAESATNALVDRMLLEH